MTSALSAAQVDALAPDAAAAAAGKKLASARSWKGLGQSERALWGECQGSALYHTRVSLVDLACKCSCPSRKFPCKHALGLLYLAAGGAIGAGSEPEWVAEWVGKRAQTVEKKEAKASARAATVADPAAQARRVQKRQETVLAGLDALEAWLDDLVRNGLARLEAESPSLWETQARRLVDAQATGLAARVRRMAGVPGSHPGWPAQLLDQLGTLTLLLHAYRRLEQLAPELQHDVRQLVGHTLEQAEVVAHGDIAEDDWHVLGAVNDDDGRMRMQRTWLRGAASGRAALVLQFAVGGAGFAETLVAGTRVRGALAFWPGALPRRALVHRRDAQQAGVELAPKTTVAAFLAGHAEALARQPWLESELAVLGGVVPVATAEGSFVVDGEDAALPLSGKQHRLLHALAGGQPVDLVGEWNGHRLRPLAAQAEGRFFALGEGAQGEREAAHG